MSTLYECPCTGKVKTVYVTHGCGSWHTKCQKCGATSGSHDYEPDAIKEHNRRCATYRLGAAIEWIRDPSNDWDWIKDYVPEEAHGYWADCEDAEQLTDALQAASFAIWAMIQATPEQIMAIRTAMDLATGDA